MTTRRISVFTRPDGKIIHDRPWDPDAPPSTAQPNPSAETLWPLIQVFLQFSREVQGGSVRRLVFRSPCEYTPEPQTFQPARAPRTRQDPLVAHISHDELFAVVVTEISAAKTLLPDDDDAAEGIAELCDTVKKFLNKQQSAFLATLDQRDVVSNRHTNSIESHSNASTNGTEEISYDASRPSESRPSESRPSESRPSESRRSEEDKPPGNAQKPVVTIDDSKLGDFIARTQTTLQL